MQYCKLYREDGNLYIHIMSMYEDRDGGDHIEVRIEKENDLDTFAKFVLPANYCTNSYGFKETELAALKKFLLNNAVGIWDMARGYIRAESDG